ncbi:ParB/RepB/Spo0J family partition protein, partial [Lachnospiraceae bacterium]|nr:ParB/RepB/Spo0J family partition protein [Lachnospiraceae bacterium]
MGSNAKSRSASKVALESFDDLFGGSAAQERGVEQIINAPLAELYTFKDHPFRVEDDEKMEETTESIRQYGVLVPGIARPRAGGGYEIIAGHRRKRGSELAGKTEMPVVVRNYTDDEATIIMVDSNIQREDILPSEKARAYKMKYEAMK